MLAAMDEISECALVLAAAVHDGARAPQEALAPYRITLDARFHEMGSALRTGAWSTPALARTEPLDPGEHDPALATVATETARVLAELQRLEQKWHESAHR